MENQTIKYNDKAYEFTLNGNCMKNCDLIDHCSNEDFPRCASLDLKRGAAQWYGSYYKEVEPLTK